MTIRISVRELVEFICRSGDIDNRRSSAGDLSAMREGARIHRMIQQRQGADYKPEVSLRLVLRFPDYEITSLADLPDLLKSVFPENSADREHFHRKQAEIF